MGLGGRNEGGKGREGMKAGEVSGHASGNESGWIFHC